MLIIDVVDLMHVGVMLSNNEVRCHTASMSAGVGVRKLSNVAQQSIWSSATLTSILFCLLLLQPPLLPVPVAAFQAPAKIISSSFDKVIARRRRRRRRRSPTWPASASTWRHNPNLTKYDASESAMHSHENDDDNSPYLLDEYGRPTSIQEWSKLIVQTPHSGRKFRQTRPDPVLSNGVSDCSEGSDGSLRSKLRSSITQLLHNPWRRRHLTENQQHSQRRRRTRRKNTNRKRFTEGWYYRLTLPTYNESFVFIFSIEDAGRILSDGTKSPLTLACMQLLGPKDTYLVQSDGDDTKFWGWKHAQALGCTFEWKEEYLAKIGSDYTNFGSESAKDCIAAMTPEEWREAVSSGFQVLPFHFQGRLHGHDGTLGGVRANQGVPGMADYDFSIRPVAGWGDYPPLLSSNSIEDNDALSESSRKSNKDKYRQFSTAGWLASFPVFEPHWQITMAHARASGSINWNGTTYEFEDAPFYGEKNWGGAFPTKWYWAQCNSFSDYPDLALTAGGGIRQLPFSFLPGKRTETLGLIGIHFDGRFFEIVPWTGEMAWRVSPWGKWEFRGRCTDGPKGNIRFEAEIVAVTDADVPGVLLRAPTKEEGMQYFCRDSGFGKVVISLWELKYDAISGDYVRSRTLIDKARSSQCTVEVGGGPWWDDWQVKSQMSKTMKRMIRLPMIVRSILTTTRHEQAG